MSWKLGPGWETLKSAKALGTFCFLEINLYLGGIRCDIFAVSC